MILKFYYANGKVVEEYPDDYKLESGHVVLYRKQKVSALIATPKDEKLKRYKIIWGTGLEVVEEVEDASEEGKV